MNVKQNNSGARWDLGCSTIHSINVTVPKLLKCPHYLPAIRCETISAANEMNGDGATLHY